VALLPFVSSLDDWDAVADGQGNLVLTWVQDGHVHAQKLSADRTPQWADTLITVSTSPARMPTGVADAAGGVYLVWPEERYANRWVLVGQHRNAQGRVTWAKEGLRISLRPSDQSRPRVVYDGQAGAVVVWKDFREAASQIMAQRMDFQGNRLWGPEGVLITAPAGEAKQFPMLAPLGDGSAAFGWIASASASSRLFLQTLTAKGVIGWAPAGINLSYGSWDEWNPSLAGDGHGLLWAGWEDYRNHSHWQVFIGTLNQDAHSAWPAKEVALAPVAADQGRLAFVEDGRHGVFAAWIDNRTGRPGLYAQELGASGRALMGEQGLAMDEQLVDPAIPQIVNLSPGHAAILYADHKKKQEWSLYWHAVNGPVSSDISEEH
jgi:hypothetical protein